ncbi:hypothetical protein MJO29_015661 [Puccinia striiformis f. sp. tritici]|nr:hypothetical protein MJO29_015661 [Puccinia striiformis f. sp. tritici]
MFNLIRTRTQTNLSGRAYLHVTSHLQAIAPLRMPALSPTMEAGQISKWSIKTGERFSAGDVLLTIETDKAEVDVEAQDDGYMGSQLFGPGSANNDIKSITVGEVIAVLGDHSDDVKGTVNVPLEWNSSNKSPNIDQVSSSDPIDHSQANPHGQVIKTILPLSPAVNRLLHDLGVKDATKIKGTGLRGRLTKGDILTHFKKVTSPLGTASKMIQADADARLAERSQLGSFSSSTTKSPQVQELEPLLPEAVRLFITEGLSDLTNRQSSPSSPTTTTSTPSPTFDSILNDYIPLHSSASNHPTTPHKSVLSHTFKSGSDLDRYFHGFL